MHIFLLIISSSNPRSFWEVPATEVVNYICTVRKSEICDLLHGPRRF